MPAIICGALWLLGGVANAVLLVSEAVTQRKADRGRPYLVSALVALTLLWVVVTVVFVSGS